MKTIKPDQRPLKEFIKAKINYEISKAPSKNQIGVDLNEFGEENELFLAICKEYERAGWHCHIYRYMTLFARNKIILSKTKKSSFLWYIDDNRQIQKKHFEYLRGPFDFDSEESAIEHLKKYLEYTAHSSKVNKKNWFQRLFE